MPLKVDTQIMILKSKYGLQYIPRHTHTYIRIRTHTLACILKRSPTCTRMDTYAYARAHAHAPHMHSPRHAQRHTHLHTHKHILTQTPIHCRNSYIYLCACVTYTVMSTYSEILQNTIPFQNFHLMHHR